MRNSKEDQAIMECYKLLFKASTPSADFEELFENAEINERGQKVIDFMSYEIDKKEYDLIIKSVIKKYKFKRYKAQQFKTTIALGCSPRFTKTKKINEDGNIK